MENIGSYPIAKRGGYSCTWGVGLTLAMLLVSASALADLVICQNKVEITAQLEAFAKLYEEKTGVPVKVITGGGSSDY
ncbi:MAG: hypothetical protein IK061_10745, partial [Desulfovibrio sp.]|nr:hypothetical protein [Desulfovibrio sp.]